MSNRSPVTAASNNPRVEAAMLEYRARVDRGEAVDLEALFAEHAEISVELKSLIACDDEARGLANGELASPDSPILPVAMKIPVLSKADATTQSIIGQVVETAAGLQKPSLANEAEHAASAESGPVAFAERSLGPPPPVIRPRKTPACPRSADDLPETFGRYRVKQKLGAGAMGAVYLAEDTLLQRTVALKTPTFKNDKDGDLLRRFYREARAVASLKHPNLCAVYDVGEIDGRHYISMEFVAGKKLQAFIRPDKSMTEKQAMAVVRKIALAMFEAHTHGVIHRDLKPDNIMVNEKGEPVVMDFGLVHKASSEESSRITQHGTLVGSPAYMSKEQVECDSDRLTGATDQYSLGVILYQLLTSKRPFQGGIHAVLVAILRDEPVRPSQIRPDLNPHLEAVCLKMMAKAPEDRYPSLKAVADALAEVAKGTSTAAGSAAVPPPAAASVANGLTATFAALAAPLELQRLVAPEIEPAPRSTAHGFAGRRHSPVVFGSLVAGVIFLAGVAFWFRSGDALVRVEVLNDDVEVTFQKDTITLKDGEKSIKATHGTHKLHVKSGDFEFETAKFTLKKGDNPTVTVELAGSDIVTRLGDTVVDHHRVRGRRKSTGVFPVGAVYRGTWENFAVGSTAAKGLSEMTVTVIQRSGDACESEWNLHTWDARWIFKGKIAEGGAGTACMTASHIELLDRDHPNEGQATLLADFEDDGTSFHGTIHYKSGNRSEFKATLADARELEVSPETLALGSTWSGTLTAFINGVEPSPMDTVAEIVGRTESGFTIRTKTRHSGDGDDTFVWEYQVSADGGKLTIKDAVLLKRTKSFSHGTGRQLIDSSRVTVKDSTMEILISRPFLRGTMQQKCTLERVKPDATPETPESDSDEDSAFYEIENGDFGTT